ncbi:hypothetical protein PIB30_069328 [Stylosanthes scabra]|uniref:F-box domain-containing protein n=1 Tax=Stylosanthes scabra TaxID=79078 RepID=A0ABU6QMP4_9FABA|nr:hypothetical protein [Stylosanthes scabra]
MGPLQPHCSLPLPRRTQLFNRHLPPAAALFLASKCVPLNRVCRGLKSIDPSWIWAITVLCSTSTKSICIGPLHHGHPLRTSIYSIMSPPFEYGSEGSEEDHRDGEVDGFVAIGGN